MLGLLSLPRLPAYLQAVETALLDRTFDIKANVRAPAAPAPWPPCLLRSYAAPADSSLCVPACAPSPAAEPLTPALHSPCRPQVNTMVALTGVILYWRGVWNLFDGWLGTDNLGANLASLGVGLSIILLFRILKLPLAEFW